MLVKAEEQIEVTTRNGFLKMQVTMIEKAADDFIKTVARTMQSLEYGLKDDKDLDKDHCLNIIKSLELEFDKYMNTRREELNDRNENRQKIYN